MNAKYFRISLAAVILAATLSQVSVAIAQNNSASAPQLPYGAAQIIQLTQARVNDDTIIAFIKNSGNSYGLNADQIIYLQQQGVSSAVIISMLNQPKAGVLAAAPAASTAQASEPAATAAATAAPLAAVVQPQPVTTYYYYSTPAPVYYYPAYPYYFNNYSCYGWYPGVTLSFGWGGRWGGWHGGFYGGGFRGGFHGGWHR